ncbi:hypothetical protein chiPu_0032570, partial [Chiloscyllium punctatum]|nr:hypothetical protein [Chiloscyllium punctatum]
MALNCASACRAFFGGSVIAWRTAAAISVIVSPEKVARVAAGMPGAIRLIASD